jgi:hypothetical protein
MLTGEFPASATLLHGQSIAGREMPSEHLASPRAFETDYDSDEFSVCMGAVNRLFRRCRIGRTGRRFYGPISIIGRSGDAL